MLECEADFMGGAAAYRFAATQSRDFGELAESHDRLIKWVRNQSIRAGVAYTYPSPEARGWAASIGWAQAEDPSRIRYRGYQPASNERERAFETCRKIVALTDGSLGMVEFTWDQLRPDPNSIDKEFILHARNRSSRAITVDLLVPTWLSIFPASNDLESEAYREWSAFDVADLRIELGPYAEFSRPMRFNGLPDDALIDDFYAYTDVQTPSPNGRYTRLISSDYSNPLPEFGACLAGLRQLKHGSSDAFEVRDLALWARIGAAALAAQSDFSAILSRRFLDDVGGKSYEPIPAVSFSTLDSVRFSTGRSYATFMVGEHTNDADYLAHYDRLAEALKSMCGESSLTSDDASNPELGRNASIAPRFSTHASVAIRSQPRGSFGTPQHSSPEESAQEPTHGGWIYIYVERTSGVGAN